MFVSLFRRRLWTEYISQGIKATCYEAKNDYDKAMEIYQEVILKISDSSNVF